MKDNAKLTDWDTATNRLSGAINIAKETGTEQRYSTSEDLDETLNVSYENGLPFFNLTYQIEEDDEGNTVAQKELTTSEAINFLDVHFYS